jgi:hypothetical protein
MLPRSTLALLALVACRVPGGPVAPESALSVTPTQLDFGIVGRTTSGKRTLLLQNTSKAPLTVHATPTWPYDAAPDTRLEAGASAALEVRFSPTVLGDAPGTLDLLWNETHLYVALHGTGLDCPAIDSCHVLQQQDGACVAVALPDGTGCDTACITGATCQAGACVGSVNICDDGDACTLDSCDPSSGCTQTAVTCAPTPCMRPTGTCDPHTGCALTPAEDGTLCGAVACAWAEVCVSGTCQRVQTPDADVDCHYTDVVAGKDLTCALTRSGHVRCWGDLSWAFSPIPVPRVAAPTMLNGFSNIVALAADYDFCTVDAAGAVHCGDWLKEPHGGTVDAPVAISITNVGNGDNYAGVVLSADGGATLWTAGQPLVPFDGGAVHGMEMDFDLWWLDEGDHLMRMQQGFVSYVADEAAGSRLTTFGGPLHWNLAAIAPDGTVTVDQNMASTTVWDAGAVTFGGSLANASGEVLEYGCAAQRGGTIICRHLFGLERRYQVPGEVVKLTGRGQFHVCALNDLGDIWCFGENTNGQLGDPPYHSEPRWLPTPVSSMAVGVTVMDGGLLEWGYPFFAGFPPPLEESDGGAEWSGAQQVAVVGRAQLVGGTPLLLDGNLLQRWDGNHLQTLATGIVSCGERGAMGCFGEAPSQFACRDVSGQLGFFGTTCIDGGQPTGGCGLFDDGSVICNQVMVRLGGRAMAISTTGSPPEGCAILDDGGVKCWPAPQFPGLPMFGISPGARQIRGTGPSGCVLVGPSTVQCWMSGDDTWGVVGQTDPSTGVSTRIFDEPIIQLASAESGGLLTTVCVQLQSGRVACWGLNAQGNAGPALIRSQQPIQIVK